MPYPRAADDFSTIRARVEELRLERQRSLTGQKPRTEPYGMTREDDGHDQRLPRSVPIKVGALRFEGGQQFPYDFPGNCAVGR